MDHLRDRVVRRFRRANVIPLPARRPKTPIVLIHGRKYVTSDYWPFGGSIEEGLAPEGGGGARLIDMGGNRFRYLWVYDTDRGLLTMWRHSDGDEKTQERASSSAHTIYTLDKKQQLNRVTHDEFVQVEREMVRRQDDTLESLKKIIEENATEWDHKVAEILEKWFDRQVRPEVERRLHELDEGVIPIGFKANPASIDSRSEERQARSHVLSNTLKSFTEAQAYDVVSKEVGFDAYEPPEGDAQAVQWEYHNLVQKVYEQYL